MKKDEFLKIINFIFDQRKKDDLLCDAIMTVCSQSNLGTFYGAYEDQLVNVLQIAMGDKEEIIAYKLYELDGNGFRTEYREKELAEKPYLATWESVYDYLKSKGDKQENGKNN